MLCFGRGRQSESGTAAGGNGGAESSEKGEPGRARRAMVVSTTNAKRISFDRTSAPPPRPPRSSRPRGPRRRVLLYRFRGFPPHRRDAVARAVAARCLRGRRTRYIEFAADRTLTRSLMAVVAASGSRRPLFRAEGLRSAVSPRRMRAVAATRNYRCLDCGFFRSRWLRASCTSGRNSVRVDMMRLIDHGETEDDGDTEHVSPYPHQCKWTPSHGRPP